MSKDSTFYYHKVTIKLKQNRNYAITNTPEQITRTFLSGGCRSATQQFS